MKRKWTNKRGVFKRLREREEMMVQTVRRQQMIELESWRAPFRFIEHPVTVGPNWRGRLQESDYAS